MILVSKFRAGRRGGAGVNPRPRCPGDSPVLSIFPASVERIRLVFSPDGRQVVACILPGEVSPRIAAMCLAVGGGTWKPSKELAEFWEVHDVLATEAWASTMFIAGAWRPLGVEIQFLD